MVMGRNVQNARRPLDGMTYWQRTFGCQMNENDAERVAGMLETAGALPVATIEEADIARLHHVLRAREGRTEAHGAGRLDQERSQRP